MPKAFSAMVTFLGYLASGLFFVAGIITFYEVVARYVFNAPTSWSMEIARLCLTWGVFLGGTYAFRAGRLVDVDLIRDRLSGWARSAISVYIVLFVFAFAVCTAYQGWLQFAQSYSSGSRTVTVLSLPVALFDAALPLGMAVLALQAIVNLAELLRGRPAKDPSVRIETGEQHVH